MEIGEEFDLAAMEQETEEMLRLRFLTKENARFAATKGGFVSLETEGEKYPRVQVFRTFPFTDPNRYISIRMPDEKAKEIGVIRDLQTDVDEETAALLTEQMKLRYFMPVIERIYQIKEEYGFAYFHVKTNVGDCRFMIHMGGASVVSLTETRLIITDLDANRFEIPDIRRLTAKELKKLDLFL